MEIVGGQLGPEAKYDVKFEAGKLSIGVDYSGDLAGASVAVSVGAKQVLEALKKAIPGTVDDTIFSAIELGLGL